MQSAGLIRLHQLDGAIAKYANTIEDAVVADHLQKSRVVVRGG
jgi:hypothetical protein